MKLKLCVTQHPAIGYRISGFIYGDTRGKFEDGDFVTTSAITELTENTIITKSGSIYEIERVELEEWSALCNAAQ